MIEAHPVADLFPLMSEGDLTHLIEDIRSHGLREPIWLHPDGRIIDGRNRYRACIEGAVEPTFRKWSGEGSLIDFVLSLNLHRRHLSQSQKAIVAVKALPLYEAEAKERQGHRSDLDDPEDIGEILPQCSERGPKATEQAGAAVGVSGRYVQDAKKIAQEAPELVPKIEAGEMSVNQAKNAAKKPARATRRQPLAEFAKSSGWAIRRAAERIERIADDDRLPANKTQVAAQLSDHLTYTIRACQEVLGRLTDQPEEV